MTFQAVLTTDGSMSFALFIYNQHLRSLYNVKITAGFDAGKRMNSSSLMLSTFESSTFIGYRIDGMTNLLIRCTNLLTTQCTHIIDIIHRLVSS